MIICLALVLFQQKDAPKPDQAKVDRAIKEGIAYLKGEVPNLQSRKNPENRDMRPDELVLWTFIHAGVPETDEAFQTLFKRVLETKEEVTYRVALKALILEEMDRVRYQPWIARCAQFLADNQCEDGGWHYGDPSIAVEDIPTPSKDVASGTESGETPIVKRKKPDVKRKILIKARRKGPKAGDNSNSQYAALGVRACVDAGIVFEKDLLARGLRCWQLGQQKDGGWNYHGPRPGPGPMGEQASYGSMTAGGVGGLIIFMKLMGQNPSGDRRVSAGMKWLEANFSVTENPKKNGWFFYYLYALERAGVLAGTEKIGTHWWYFEGAEEILKRQQDDGSWGRRGPPKPPQGGGNGGMDNRPGPAPGDPVVDTCFAILFLRRAARPFEDVATGEKKR